MEPKPAMKIRTSRSCNSSNLEQHSTGDSTLVENSSKCGNSPQGGGTLKNARATTSIAMSSQLSDVAQPVATLLAAQDADAVADAVVVTRKLT